MNIYVKIWLTLAVLCLVAIGVVKIDDGDTILTSIAIIEIISFIVFSVSMTLYFIWKM